MKQSEIKIGMTVMTYIGSEIAPVQVIREMPPIPGYKRNRHEVKRVNSDRPLPGWRTAAAFRLE